MFCAGTLLPGTCWCLPQTVCNLVTSVSPDTWRTVPIIKVNHTAINKQLTKIKQNVFHMHLQVMCVFIIKRPVVAVHFRG